MREDTRTGSVIHFASTGGGGAGSFVADGQQGSAAHMGHR